MENLHIWLFVLWASGLLEGRAVEDLIRRGNVLVRCTNENNSKIEIQLWCNMEKFICLMDVGQEVIIDQSPIQLSDRKSVFRARREGAQNSVLANYSCRTDDQVNVSGDFSTAPGPDIPAFSVYPRFPTLYWNKQQAKVKEAQESNSQRKEKEKKKEKEKDKKKDKKKKKCKNNQCSGDEDSGGSEDGENEDGQGEYDNDDKDGGQRRGGHNRERHHKQRNVNSVQLHIAVLGILAVILLVLAACCLLLWRKRKLQSHGGDVGGSAGTLKAGGANDQKLQAGDCEKVVTVYVKATNPENVALPPAYSPTSPIYQEITDSPQDFAEVIQNPLYTPNGHPSQEQQSG